MASVSEVPVWLLLLGPLLCRRCPWIANGVSGRGRAEARRPLGGTLLARPVEQGAERQVGLGGERLDHVAAT